jgi:hypothetical protein
MLWGFSGLFPARRETTEADALAILRARYARGEISRAEFLQASAPSDTYQNCEESVR